MRNSKFIDFNKEILFGELGALLGAPIFGVIGSLMSRSPDFISLFTIVGSIFGGSVLWLVTKFYDEKKENRFTVKKFAYRISLFTPVAFTISILVTYPIIFFVTHALSSRHHVTFLSSLSGEVVGFCVFLILINTYRYVLIKSFRKEL